MPCAYTYISARLLLQHCHLYGKAYITGADKRQKHVQALPNIGEVALQAAQPLLTFKLNTENLAALGQVVNHLKLKAYRPISKLTTLDMKGYLLKWINEGLSENTMQSRINALEYHYEQVLLREKFFVEIPRPKKPFLLPAFFNQDEIAAIINATHNIL